MGKLVTPYMVTLINPSRVKRKYGYYKNIEGFIRKNYPVIMSYIRSRVVNKTCPVCGRTFLTYSSLYRHLSYEDCGHVVYIIAEMIARHLPEKNILEALRDMGLELEEPDQASFFK